MNDLGIPPLSPALQAFDVINPTIGWGSQCRRSQVRGTIHFYTEDYRFEALWRKPNRLVDASPQVVIEPNFSIWDQTPKAVALYQIYRKRWLAQYWQTFGIKILVDLNVASHARNINLLGVPRGWRAYATHGYVDRLEDTHIEYEMACQHAGGNDILFVVYGGGNAVGQVCLEHDWLWIPERMTQVRLKRWPKVEAGAVPRPAGNHAKAADFFDKLANVTPV